LFKEIQETIHIDGKTIDNEALHRNEVTGEVEGGEHDDKKQGRNLKGRIP